MQELDINIDEETRLKQLEMLNVFASSLQKKAEECVSNRKTIENRWLADMRNYHGVYGETIKSGSDLFVNITRPKAVAAESRISDMLFPTDDRNFSIQPTPVPELEEKTESQTPIPGVANEQGQQATEADIANSLISEAVNKAEKMQDEIDDQLNECDYNSKGRDCIHDAVVLGTGVIKGPVNTLKQNKKWSMLRDEVTGEEVAVLEIRPQVKPETFNVDIWNFFPEMSARTMDECEYVFERHLLTKKQLRDLAEDSTFMVDQIRDILKGEPKSTTADYLNQLRAINRDEGTTEFNRYEVWEYHGPIEKEDLLAAGIDIDIDDTLSVINGIVWFCDGKVIKVISNPNETGELPYDVFNWEEDSSSVFGFGVPHLINNSQRVVNAAWRMMMNNAALSVGPQVVINDHLIEPAPVDGKIDWNITSNKVWRLKDKDRNVNEAFGAFHINSHQDELANIFQLARELGDAETNLPMIAQGEYNGPQQVNTATGMNLLLSSANIALKKAVKNFDDNITRKHIRRYYDWNMQNSDKAEIKGDFNIDARGSNTLIVKETQAQNMQALVNVAQIPPFAQITNWQELYKQAINSMQIKADTIINDTTDGEITPEEAMQMQQQMQEMGQQMQQMQQELQSRQHEIQIKQMQAQVEQAKIESNENIAVMKLRAETGMKIEEIQAKMGMEQEKNKTNRDITALNVKSDIAKQKTRRMNMQQGFDSY